VVGKPLSRARQMVSALRGEHRWPSARSKLRVGGCVRVSTVVAMTTSPSYGLKRVASTVWWIRFVSAGLQLHGFILAEKRSCKRGARVAATSITTLNGATPEADHRARPRFGLERQHPLAPTTPSLWSAYHRRRCHREHRPWPHQQAEERPAAQLAGCRGQQDRATGGPRDHTSKQRHHRGQRAEWWAAGRFV